MKKLLIIMFLLVGALGAAAQDVIVKKDGSTVVCKVLEVNASSIIYKAWADLQGANYVMDLSLAQSINYQDGRKDTFADVSNNQYTPWNQNTGAQQLNDNALLALDKAITKKTTPKEAKKLQIIAATVGSVLFLGGFGVMCWGIQWGGFYFDDDGWPQSVAGVVLMAGGVATITACLAKANKIKQEASLYAASLYQHEFKFDGGSSFACGADLMRDNKFKTNALGLGLRYTF